MCHSNKLKYDVDCLKLSINMKKIQLLNYNPVHTVYEKESSRSAGQCNNSSNIKKKQTSPLT